MGDRFDDLMAKCRPDIEKRITAGLAEGRKLESYVRVDALEHPSSYRMTSTPWIDKERSEDLVLRQCNPLAEGAWELVRTMNVEVDQLRDNSRKVLDDVKEFAKSARQEERRIVMKLIADEKPDIDYDVDNVVTEVERLQGPCRLIGKGQIANEAKKRGIVEEVTEPDESLPTGVSAMLIRMTNGPAVQRVEDLSLSWQRKAADRIEFRLSERFFMDGVEHAVKFVDGGGVGTTTG